MTTTTCGHFSFDGIRVQGPADYLEARGLDLLDRILAGEDSGLDLAGHVNEAAVLGRLEQDYQDWLAAREAP
jgi:hypothetical protein